jgi:hypothetical protein
MEPVHILRAGERLNPTIAAYLERVEKALRPTLDEVERIEGGLEQVHRALGSDAAARRRCRDALRGLE